MRKLFRYILITAVMLFGLCSCGKEEDSPSCSVFSLNKDGGVSYTLVEAFPDQIANESGDLINLSKDSLKNLLDQEIKAFNEKSAHKRVSLKSFEILNGQAIIASDFGSYEDFMQFCDVECFLGDIEEAKAKGFDLYTARLKDNKENSSGKPIESGVLSDKNLLALIIKRPEIDVTEVGFTDYVDRSLTVNLYNNILYIDEDTTFKSKKQVLVSPGDGYAYIIFKK